MSPFQNLVIGGLIVIIGLLLFCAESLNRHSANASDADVEDEDDDAWPTDDWAAAESARDQAQLRLEARQREREAANSRSTQE